MKTRIGIIGSLLIAGLLVSVALVSAQQPPPAPQTPAPGTPAYAPHPPMDPLHDAMFPPEMIMQHTRELGLTDEQKAFMRGEIQKTTTRFNELQWQLQDAMEALHEIMKSTSVNEQQALTQLDKVLDAEREIKRLHISMALRIKNRLTPEQQEKLHAMRWTPHPPGGPGHGPEGMRTPGAAPRPEGPPRPEGQPRPDEDPLP
jgi:Spy/CpxP family protein refolding chaperone